MSDARGAASARVCAAVLAAGMLALAGTEPAEAAFPGANGKILFVSTRDGNGELYTMNPNGSLQQRITISPAEDTFATFSPDGTKLLVTYDDGSAWLFDLPAGTGGKTDWSGLVETTWQARYATP